MKTVWEVLIVLVIGAVIALVISWLVKRHKVEKGNPSIPSDPADNPAVGAAIAAGKKRASDLFDRIRMAKTTSGRKGGDRKDGP
jgi:hypothetical protein